MDGGVWSVTVTNAFDEADTPWLSVTIPGSRRRSRVTTLVFRKPPPPDELTVTK